MVHTLGKAMSSCSGGRGCSTRLDRARILRQGGATDEDIRKALKKDGLSKCRISQVLSATRESSTVGAVPRSSSKMVRKRPANHDVERSPGDTGPQDGNVKQEEEHHEETPGSGAVDVSAIEKESSGSTSPSNCHEGVYRFKIQDIDENFKVKATSKGKRATLVSWSPLEVGTDNIEDRTSSPASRPRWKGLKDMSPEQYVNRGEAADSHAKVWEKPSSSSWGQRLRHSSASFDLNEEDYQAKVNPAATQNVKECDGESGLRHTEAP